MRFFEYKGNSFLPKPISDVYMSKIAIDTKFEDVYAANNQIKYEFWEKYKQQFEALSQPPIF